MYKCQVITITVKIGYIRKDVSFICKTEVLDFDSFSIRNVLYYHNPFDMLLVGLFWAGSTEVKMVKFIINVLRRYSKKKFARIDTVVSIYIVTATLFAMTIFLNMPEPETTLTLKWSMNAWRNFVNCFIDSNIFG